MLLDIARQEGISRAKSAPFSLSEHHVPGSQLSATPARQRRFPLFSEMIKGAMCPLNRLESQGGVTDAALSPSNKADWRQADFLLISGMFSLIPPSPGQGWTD